MTTELTSAIGATAGAVIGAAISFGAVRIDGRSDRITHNMVIE
jgi:hypothetical protein